MRSTFLLFGLTSALAFATGGTVLAQRGHGGRHLGGGHVGGSHIGGSAGHGAWGHAGRFGYGNGRWEYGHGYRYGPSIGFGFGYPFGASYGYPYGSSLYYGLPPAADGADDYGQLPTYDYGAMPTTGEALPAAPTTAQPVTLTVFLPASDAELSLNGTATTLQGVERKFQSPPLTPGQNYHYVVTAKWTENGHAVEQTQDVPVAAGQAVTVDFRQAVK